MILKMDEITARNKPNFLRILNFAEDVNFAMESSRRSESAFAASNSMPEHKEVIKPVLDFNFQASVKIKHPSTNDITDSEEKTPSWGCRR